MFQQRFTDMNKIYVVKASGGSYDDAWESSLFAVGDAQTAELAVWDLQEQHKFLEKVWPDIQQVLQHGMKAVRDFKYEVIPPAPKGLAKASKEQLAEHRKAFNEWRKVSEPIQKRNEAQTDRLMKEAVEATRVHAISLGCTEEHLKELNFYNHAGELTYPNFRSDTSYDFEELELR